MPVWNPSSTQQSSHMWSCKHTPLNLWLFEVHILAPTLIIVISASKIMNNMVIILRRISSCQKIKTNKNMRKINYLNLKWSDIGIARLMGELFIFILKTTRVYTLCLYDLEVRGSKSIYSESERIVMVVCYVSAAVWQITAVFLLKVYIVWPFYSASIVRNN